MQVLKFRLLKRSRGFDDRNTNMGRCNNFSFVLKVRPEFERRGQRIDRTEGLELSLC